MEYKAWISPCDSVSMTSSNMGSLYIMFVKVIKGDTGNKDLAGPGM